jgi:hypothetical protein
MLENKNLRNYSANILFSKIKNPHKAGFVELYGIEPKTFPMSSGRIRKMSLKNKNKKPA